MAMVAAPIHTGSPRGLREGDTVGKYLIVRLLGQGATANVYLATDSARGRFVALKAMRPELSGQVQVRDMFTFEANLLTQFDHHNVVRAVEVGELGSDPYLVLEYLDGAPLHQILGAAVTRSIRIPLGIVGRLISGALDGLEHVHSSTKTRRGVVHCDISPYNLFATYEGVTKLIDFGIARVGTKAQRVAEVRGRYAYMSPEQALSRPFDERADLFSIGVVLWEVLAGQRLFRRRDDETTKQAMLTMRVPRLSEVGVEVPAAVEDVIRRALLRDPLQRFGSAAEMREALHAAIGELASADTVAAFCSRLTGGSLLTPGISSLAMSQRGAEMQFDERMQNATAAPVMPTFKPEELAFGNLLQGLAPNFGESGPESSALPPAFRSNASNVVASQALVVAPETASMPMFEDEFTVMADGVVAIRGSAQPTSPQSIPSEALVHTHTPMHQRAPKPHNPASRWPLYAAAGVLLSGAVALGLVLWRDRSAQHDLNAIGAEPLAPPAELAPSSTEAVEPPLAPDAPPPIDDAAANEDLVIEMKDGYLDVMIEGGTAEVHIDGKKVGKTPLKAFVLPPGPHQVLLLRGGDNVHQETIEVVEGRVIALDVKPSAEAVELP